MQSKSCKPQCSVDQVQFIDTVVSELHEVKSCASILARYLFARGVVPVKSGYIIQEDIQRELVTTWTVFAKRMFWSLVKYGLAICDIMEQEDSLLDKVPIVYDFEQCTITFDVDAYDQKKYIVRRKNRRLTDAFVVERYPPKRDGSLTSPMARLIPTAYELLDKRDKVSRTIDAAVTQPLFVERVMDKSNYRVAVPGASDVGAAGYMDPNGTATLACNGARVMSRLAPGALDCDEADRLLDQYMKQRDKPASEVTDNETGRKYLVFGLQTRPIGDGTRVPYIPNIESYEQRFETNVSMEFDVPRSFWTRHSDRLSNDVKRDMMDLQMTIDEWGNFFEDVLFKIWMMIYVDEETTLQTLCNVPQTQITLPATTSIEQLKLQLADRLISEQTFREKASAALGIKTSILQDEKDKQPCEDKKMPSKRKLDQAEQLWTRLDPSQIQEPEEETEPPAKKQRTRESKEQSDTRKDNSADMEDQTIAA